MHPPSPHRYVNEGQRAGRSPDVLQHAASQIETSFSRGATPILSLRHLAHLTGASHSYLRAIVERESNPYKEITLPKKTGGVRPIAAPEPMLMDVQRFILRSALRRVPLHSSSFAYQEHRAILDCAQRHIGAKWLVKMDLHDFFGQVSEKQVYGVFQERGYSALAAFELARLCTRIQGPMWRGASRYTAIPTYGGVPLGILPQGAPTSGALANAVATPMDYALSDLARHAGVVYTRYSDDLAFSAGRSFDRAAAANLIGKVTRVVADSGFAVRRKKTRVVPPGARHIVLGLLVDEQDVRLLPEFRKRIEGHIRGVEKFGLVAHAEYRGFRSLLSFISHIDGSLAFASSIEPLWTSRARANWESGLLRNGFPLSMRSSTAAET